MAGSFKDLFVKQLPPHAEWITNGILPKQGMLLMGGPAKTRKTFLALDMAHALGSGAALWGTAFEAPEKANVLYVEAEVGEYELQRRIKLKYDVLGQDPPEGLCYVSKEKGLLLDTVQGIQKLSKFVDLYEPQVIIIDPISRCLLGDESDSRSMGVLFQRLDELMIDYKAKDLSLVLVHHHRKPSNDESFDALSAYNFRGSSRFFDAPDAIVSFQKMDHMPGEWARVKTGWELRQAQVPEEKIILAVLPGGVVRQIKDKDEAQVVAGPRALRPALERRWGR